MLVSFGSLLALAAIALAAFGIGRSLLRLLGIAAGDPLATAVWSVSAGLLVWGHLIVFLSAAALLQAEFISAATVVAAGCGAIELLIAWARPTASEANPLADRDAAEGFASLVAGSVVGLAILAAAIAAGAVLAIGCLAPATSADAISQLELPKRWLVAGHATLAAGDTASDWLLPRAWSIWGLALAGGEGARMVGCLLGALFAASAAVWATPFLGRRSAYVVAAIVLLAPAVMQQVVLLNPAVPAAACGLLAATAWQNACQQRHSGKWAILAGVAVGSVLSGIGLPAALLFTLLALTHGAAAAVNSGPGRHWSRVRLLCAAIALTASLCLLPHWLLERTTSLPGRPVPDTWPVGGVTILMVVLLPGLLWAGLPERLRTAWVAVPAYILFTLPLIGRPAVYLVLVPLLATAAVWVLNEMGRLPAAPRRVATAALVVGAMATLAAPVVQFSRALTAVATADGRDAYLDDREPVWSAAVVANCVMPPRAHLLSQADGAFYFDRRVTTAASLDRWIEGQAEANGTSQWAARLRAAGYTHVLLVDSQAPAGDAVTLTEYNRLGHRYRLLKLP